MGESIVKKLRPRYYMQAVAHAFLVLLMGILIMFFPSRFDIAPAYEFIRDLVCREMWGIAFVISGIGIFAGIHFKKYLLLRIALSFSIALSSAWGIGFTVALLDGQPLSATIPLIHFYIAFTGYLLASDPLRELIHGQRSD